MTDDPSSRVALALTFSDVDLIRIMLAKVDFKHAHPICQLLVNGAVQQQLSGLQSLLQAALDKQQERVALMTLSTPEGALN
jgi:hypothetical protein